MRVFPASTLRRSLAALFAATAIGAATLPAAAADVTIAPNATPLPRLAQGYEQASEYGAGYYDNYRPACPDRYYFTCRYDPAGIPHCACWPGLGFYLYRY